MELLEWIKIPLASVRVCYYTQMEISATFPESDLFIGVFTEDGLSYYQDVLSMQVVSADAANGVLYLSAAGSDESGEERVNAFWSLFTHYGPFRWKPGAAEKRQKDACYALHKKYFTFTDELVV